jgi:hypothetical protein
MNDQNVWTVQEFIPDDLKKGDKFSNNPKHIIKYLIKTKSRG